MIFSFIKTLKPLAESIIHNLIHTNFDKCTGCSICQLACSMNFFGGYNPRLSRLIILKKKESLYHFPIVCNQCENAYCMNVCPAKAIKRNAEGIVVIDPDTCMACGLCSEYCPIGVVGLDPETGKAFKCELCQGTPLCIEVCPTGALEFVRRDEGKIDE